MTAPHILVVDDDKEIRRLVAVTLERDGFDVSTAADAAAMDAVLAGGGVDLILLDVMMPGENGLTACARVAKAGGPPVVMLSALGEVNDRVAGLDRGAGHYLPKPCTPRELVATVRAALRGCAGPGEPDGRRFAFAGWRADFGARELTDPEGVLVDLTDGEFAVLRAFIERPRRVLSRDMLLDAARGRDCGSYDRAIDIQVSRLRRKLRATGDTIIRTVRQEGYLFVPSVSRA